MHSCSPRCPLWCEVALIATVVRGRATSFRSRASAIGHRPSAIGRGCLLVFAPSIYCCCCHFRTLTEPSVPRAPTPITRDASLCPTLLSSRAVSTTTDAWHCLHRQQNSDTLLRRKRPQFGRTDNILMRCCPIQCLRTPPGRKDDPYPCGGREGWHSRNTHPAKLK